MKPSPILGALAVLACATTARAHDFWIEPASFHPPKDARLAIDLRVGELFAGEAVERSGLHIVRFVSVSGEKETPILGFEGRAPAGIAHFADSGLIWIAYQSTTTPLELRAAKFEKYLAAEGLDHVIAARAARGEGAKDSKEIYSRSVKSLLLVGDGPHTGFDKVLGLPLELVPLVDATVLHPGDKLPVRLLFRGKPLVHALVGCRAKADSEHEARLRTDEKGEVTFELPAAGPTLIRVVHMVEAPKNSGADWESVWASLSFETRPKPEIQPAPEKPVPGSGLLLRDSCLGSSDRR